MAKENIWFETAKNHLRVAKKNLEIGEYLTAFHAAIYCTEIALKAVLVKNKKFSNQDKHHKIPKLLEKIKSEHCLPPKISLQLENLVGNENIGGLGYIDLPLPDSLLETTSGHHVNLRYPIGSSIPNDLVSTHIASEKTRQADQLIKILSHLFYAE